jgi:hypothetical protein
MVGGLLVVPGIVVFASFCVVLSSMCGVFCCLLVVLGCFLGHGVFPPLVWLPVGRPYSPGKQRNSRISEAFLCDKHPMSMIDLASWLGSLGRLGWVIRPAPCAAIFAQLRIFPLPFVQDCCPMLRLFFRPHFDRGLGPVRVDPDDMPS